MDVAVDIAGHNGKRGAVKLLHAVVFADADYFFADDRYVAPLYFTRKHVDVGGVF